MIIILKSAKILCPTSSHHGKKMDVLIENGIIKKIDSQLSTPKNAKEISLSNLHVSLGWFDSGVCFGEPGYEERETIVGGLSVAAQSGFTGVLLNPDIVPTPDTGTHIEALISKSKSQACSLYPIGALTLGGKGVDLAEMFDMESSGAVAFSDYKRPISKANLLKIALQYSQNFDGLIMSYPHENSIGSEGMIHEGHHSTSLGLKSIPSLCEELQILRDIAILRYTGGKLHIPTISTKEAVALIKSAKAEGLDISCSVSIHHLIFSDKNIDNFEAKYKVLPPLRSDQDIKSLRKALLSGVIDFVTTDHSPVNLEKKQLDFCDAAYGTLGLESAFGVMNKLFGVEKSVEIMSKGRPRFSVDEPILEENEMANLSLFNPEGDALFENRDILSNSNNSAFVGHPIKGKVYGIINNHKAFINGKIYD